MGLGQIILATYGKENCILSNKPDITFFKKVYNYNYYISNETLPQYFKSTPTFGRRVTVKLSKHGDLISNITLFIELPELPQSKHSVLPTGVKKIAWVKKIALALIKYIDLEIGGRIVSRHYSDWLNIDYLFNSKQDGFHYIIGDTVDIITNYTDGKKSYNLYLPLKFFFNTDINQAFPIISIPKQDIKIHIEFNSFNNCIKEQPTHYIETNDNICLFNQNEIIRQNVDGNITIARFNYFDVSTKRIYFEQIYNTFTIPTIDNTKYKITGDTSLFSITPKVSSLIITDEKYIYNNEPIIKNAYLLVNYIYIGSNEQWFFTNNTINYLVPLINTVLEKDMININNIYKLTLTHPTKLIVWRAILRSNIDIKDYFNYSAYPLLENDEPLITNNKLVINSTPRCEIDNYEFYTFFQNYINNFYHSEHIYQFSLGLKSKEQNEYGSLNFSKIDDVYLNLTLNNIVNYKNLINIKAYSIYYNVYEISNGTSSFKFIF